MLSYKGRTPLYSSWKHAQSYRHRIVDVKKLNHDIQLTCPQQPK